MSEENKPLSEKDLEKVSGGTASTSGSSMSASSGYYGRARPRRRVVGSSTTGSSVTGSSVTGSSSQ